MSKVCHIQGLGKLYFVVDLDAEIVLLRLSQPNDDGFARLTDVQYVRPEHVVSIWETDKRTP